MDLPKFESFLSRVLEKVGERRERESESDEHTLLYREKVECVEIEREREREIKTVNGVGLQMANQRRRVEGKAFPRFCRFRFSWGPLNL